MEIGCINYKKPEVFLCHVKMQLRVMIILNLSGNTAEYLTDRSEIRDRICQKERTDIHIWTKLSI